MKKNILVLVFLIPFVAYSQNKSKKDVSSKVVSSGRLSQRSEKVTARVFSSKHTKAFFCEQCKEGETTQTQIIEYNFKGPDSIGFTYPKALKQGNAVLLKVYNVNRLVYDIKVDNDQFRYYSEAPASLGKALGIEPESTSNIENAVKNAREETKKVEAATEAKDDTHNKKKTGILDTVAYNKSLSILLDKAKVLNDLFNKLEECKTAKNALVNGIKTIEGPEESLEFIEKIKREYKFIQNPRKLLDEFNTAAKNFDEGYHRFLVDTNVMRMAKSQKAEIQDILEDLVKSVEDVKTKVDNYKYEELFRNIDFLCGQFHHPEGFYVASAPIQVKSGIDMLTLRVSIRPKANIESDLITDTKDFTLEIPVVGFFKVDFSTGIFMSTLFNRTYSFLKESGDTGKLKENGHDILTPFIGALVHATYKYAPGFSFGGAAGVGIKGADLDNTNYIAAITGIFGRQQRWSATIGATLGKVSRLKTQYATGESFKLGDNTATFTEDIYRPGFIFGLSYIITKTKKESSSN